MLSGRATPAATRDYAERHQPRFAADFYADPLGLRLSSLALGTYLGEPDDATDRAYEDAVEAALRSGVNCLDTAVNYREQRSERLLGRTLARLVEAGVVTRGEVVVATKGGYVPRDFEEPERGGASLVAGVPPEEVVQGIHCLHPRYLERMLALSRSNLGLAALDVYYLHNPETQLPAVAKPVFYERIRRAFTVLEGARERGELGAYGVATWSGLRRAAGDPGALDLARVVDIARSVGGDDHGFRFVQLPVNLALPEALTRPGQTVDGEALPALAAAERLGLSAFGSGALHQGRLLDAAARGAEVLDPDGRLTPAQRALRFARSTGVVAALVGTSSREHLAEDLAAGALPRLDPAAVAELAAATGARGEA